MKILGLVLGLLVEIFGGFLLFVDIYRGNIGGLVSVVSTASIMGIQFILILIAFFLPEGAGMGIIITSMISLLIAIFGGAIFAMIISVLMLISGFLIVKGMDNVPEVHADNKSATSDVSDKPALKIIDAGLSDKKIEDMRFLSREEFKQMANPYLDKLYDDLTKKFNAGN
jgi:hypothetical protein